MRSTCWSSRLLPLALACAGLGACANDSREEEVTQTEGRVTWYQDVAPIVAEHCMGCHREGGIGPMSLTEYEQASDYATRMVSYVEKGIMPPFDARESDDCTPRFSWKDDPRLSDAELATLRDWISDGRPEGTRAEIPLPPSTELSGVTKTLTPSEPFTTSGTSDQFICYVLDPSMPAGGWLTGLQVRPDNELVVHHVVVTELMPGAEHDTTVAAHPVGTPWDCGQSGTPGAFVVNIWTPGNQPMETSDDLAVPILGGAKLVMNIHYHPAGGVHEPDATSLDLRTSTVWPKKMYFVGGFGNEKDAPSLLPGPNDRTATPEFRIPANAAAHTEHMRVTIPQLGDLQNVRLYSANPHMHMVGTKISATIERPAARGTDPKQECLANGAWNFDWQRTYIYDAPLDSLPSIQAGDILDMKCSWDNTMANPFVQRALHDAGLAAPIDIELGEGSLDEMCVQIFGLAIDAPPAPPMGAMMTMPQPTELPLELMASIRAQQ